MLRLIQTTCSADISCFASLFFYIFISYFLIFNEGGWVKEA
jgi:hypothetical protein